MNSACKTILQTDAIRIAADTVTGSVASFQLYGEELLAPAVRSSDLALNGVPLDLRVAPHTWTNLGGYPSAGDPVNEMHAAQFISHYTGYGLDVTRSVRAVQPNQVALTYTVQRTKIRTLPECPGAGWGALEAPLAVTSLTMPCWPWKFFGDKTRMIALNTGSNGPREHLGYENGPVAGVKAVVDTWFRRQYSGVLGLPGALFYEPERGHWLAITCRRPAIAYNLNHTAAADGVAFDFLPMGEMRLHQTVQLPQVLFHAGCNRESMEQFLADQLFRYYEEPADWVWRTTWCSLSAVPENFGSWQQVHQAALRVTERGGATGIFLMSHQRNLAFGGTSPNGVGPCEELGPRREFEKMVRDLKSRGIRLMTWWSTCGFNPQGDVDPDWFVRGVDGDWLPAWGLPHQPHIVYINPLHPGYQAFFAQQMQYYLGDLGMDAVHFDCAGFAYPYDFAPRSFMRYPSDLMLANVRFFDFVRETFQRIKPEAAVFTEGHGLDAFSNITSLMTNTPSEIDGLSPRTLLLALQQRAGKRLAVRSGCEADLGSGWVEIPEPDLGNSWGESAKPADADHILKGYAQVGTDPFNILLTRIVSEHGCRVARHLPCGGGVSLLGRYLVVPQPRKDTIAAAALVPVPRGERCASGVRVTLPAEVRRLRNLITGQTIESENGAFVFHDRGIFELE